MYCNGTGDKWAGVEPSQTLVVSSLLLSYRSILNYTSMYWPIAFSESLVIARKWLIPVKISVLAMLAVMTKTKLATQSLVFERTLVILVSY